MSKQAFNENKKELLKRIDSYIDDLKNIDLLNSLVNHQFDLSPIYEHRIFGIIEAARILEVLTEEEIDEITNKIHQINKN